MKKGFIFVETMVVIAFLGTVLISVYSAFTTVLDNAKTRLYYDDPVYLYRSYYILAFLEENNLTDYIKAKFGSVGAANSSTYIAEFGCTGSLSVLQGENQADKNEIAFCTKMVEDWEVSHIFIMPYIVDTVVACADNTDPSSTKDVTCYRNPALQNLTVQAVNYLYSLDGFVDLNTRTDDLQKEYRLVIEFKKKDSENAYTWYNYEKNNEKNTSTITLYKYYYTSLEIPFGVNSNNLVEREFTAAEANYQVKDKYFISIDDAIAYASSGDTIKLLRNYTETAEGVFTKSNITFNLNGKTLTLKNYPLSQTNGKTTITNGKITSILPNTINVNKGEMIFNKSLGNLTIENLADNLAVNSDTEYAVVVGNRSTVFDRQAKLEVTDGVTITAGGGSSTKYARGLQIQSSGYVKFSGGTINVNANMPTASGGTGGIGISSRGILDFESGVINVVKLGADRCGICNMGIASITGGNITVNNTDNITGNLIDGGALDSLPGSDPVKNSSGNIIGRCTYVTENPTFKCTDTLHCILDNNGYIYYNKEEPVIKSKITFREKYPTINSSKIKSIPGSHNGVNYNKSNKCLEDTFMKAS